MQLIKIVLLILFILIIVQIIAYITLLERHLLSRSQIRLGPNKIRFIGFIQPLIDGIKLLKKEEVLTEFSSNIIFITIPSISFLIIMLDWLILPYKFTFILFEYSLLFFLCLLGVLVYCRLLVGIMRKSKYRLLGGIRMRSQSVSYEIAFSIYIIRIVINWKRLYFIRYYSINLIYIFILYLILVLRELNRAPFDFAEGERELVSGFNVEYSSIGFVLLFLREYGFILFFRFLFSAIFFNSALVIRLLIFRLILWIRSRYPRFRYDLLIYLLWFSLLPLTLIIIYYYLSINK